MRQVIIQKSAQKEIDHLPDYIYKKVIRAILSLKVNPFPTGFKKLSGRENEYRIKAGDYRILYSIDNTFVTIYVFRVRHRKDVYRKD